MKINLLLAILMLCCCQSLLAKVVLPKIFSNNMVLQRDKPVNIWGWGDKNEKVSVSFNGKRMQAKPNKNGEWTVTFPQVSAGGPFTIEVKGSNSIKLENVMTGDVWVCSGQSNMEWTLANTKNAVKEIAEANYPGIRHFTVGKQTAYKPRKDLKGGEWKICDSSKAGEFSAVAYFFARKLNRELNVPIGLINTSWGGTNIQTWTSWDVMKNKMSYKEVDLDEKEKASLDVEKKADSFKSAFTNDIGMRERWYEAPASEGWKNIQLPSLWEQTEIGNADGIVWFKKEFDLDQLPSEAATLNLGPIDDLDSTYVNGKFVGSVNSYNKDRIYTVDPSILKTGKNQIVIKAMDFGGGGGIYGKPEQLFVQAGSKKIPLTGEWFYKPSVLSTSFGIEQSGPNAFPSQLYNAMVSPIVKYNIKGAIWYQGEANTGEAGRYQKLFPEMIDDWRKKWDYEFPFLWVQLANFMAADSLPKESDWAELREAQTKTLALPATGQAVTIDIGEAEDIHPRNKQDVGFRLALSALKTAYGQTMTFSGPVLKTMAKEGDKIILSFTETGTGLLAKDKYGYLKGFSIAGSDKKFHWAQAKIDGDKIIVWQDGLQNPEAVRYAWANNPDDANLYNKEGLPASPFRTDDWPGITQHD